MRTDHRRGKVLRRLAGDDPEVNEEWNCDKGRCGVHATPAARPPDHTAGPRRARRAGARLLARGTAPPPPTGLARPRSRRGRRADRRPGHRRGRLRLRQVRPGRPRHQRRRLPRPARTAPRRPTSWPPRRRARVDLDGRVTYATLEAAPAVLLAGFEPEEESPIVFLRLRKARRKRPQVFAIAAHATRGLAQARRRAAAGRARRRSRVAGRARRRRGAGGRRRPRRRAAAQPRRGDPGRRAARRGPWRADRRRPAGRCDRRQARLGAAPGR